MNNNLQIISYLRQDELLTQELVDIGNILVTVYPKLTMSLYCETIQNYSYLKPQFIINQQIFTGTKYIKLLDALAKTEADYLLSLDNDIAADNAAITHMVNEFIANKYAIGWGKIYSREVNNFVSQLVMVDKLLSHNFLRPTLWKLGIGITIPGQCFVIKVNAFKDKLNNIDTYLDDLSVGIYSAQNHLNYLFSKQVVAYELPSYSLSGLANQRRRWATGYSQLLEKTKPNTKEKKLLLIHAFSYHLIPILYWVLLLILATNKFVIFILLVLIVGVILTFFKPKYILSAILYQLIFPVFHFIWLKQVIKELL